MKWKFVEDYNWGPWWDGWYPEDAVMYGCVPNDTDEMMEVQIPFRGPKRTGPPGDGGDGSFDGWWTRCGTAGRKLPKYETVELKNGFWV